ncbi:hypothetical protein AVEN_137332-1 [Araneus ventricosus]|uniref:Uncharacterized protein n=1 Tax=Araneus ventricosus TaxID=182803 RepID=A0A4Y2FHV1_ARAVE|nr:hypothetical protein AVEN_137332-1 [Araneus ventricosus]
MVDVASFNAVTILKDQFLSNVENQKEILKFLSTEFKNAKFPVFLASSDAGVLIVEMAETETESGHSAIVDGTNSDLLALIAVLTQPQVSCTC